MLCCRRKSTAKHIFAPPAQKLARALLRRRGVKFLAPSGPKSSVGQGLGSLVSTGTKLDTARGVATGRSSSPVGWGFGV